MVLLILLAILIIAFTPIYLESDLHYDINRKKFAFVLYLYGIFKIVGGYVTTYQGGFAFHIRKDKAILLPYSRLDSERKKFSFIQTFRLHAFTLTTETGAEYLALTALMHTILRIYFFIIGGKKERIENNLWLTDGDVLRVSLNSVLFFNLFILLCNFFKFLKEKLTILWQKNKKKSTN